MSADAIGKPGGAEDVVLSVAEATRFGERALERLGFSAEEAGIIAANLVDAELCGYPALGLARVLTIAEHARMKQPRKAVSVVHETPVSATVDGGNTVGFYAVYRGQLLPEGAAIDAQGLPTRDPLAALAGAILPFGAHKGCGLSLTIQALGLLAGAALPSGRVQDFGFLFIVFDPALLVPMEQFKHQLAELLARVKATPLQPGHEEIRIPSESAFRARRRRRVEGFVLERRVYERIKAL